MREVNWAELNPVGLRPRWIFEREVNTARLDEVLDAKVRYKKAGKAIPVEWEQEWSDLLATRRKLFGVDDTAEALRGVMDSLNSKGSQLTDAEYALARSIKAVLLERRTVEAK